VLRTYLYFTTRYYDEYLLSGEDVTGCVDRLRESDIFRSNGEYVRKQLVHSLLEEDESAVIHMISSILLHDGRYEEQTFEMMNAEGCFPRLLELIRSRGDENRMLYRSLLQLLYEMCRMQRLSQEELHLVDDEFVRSQLQMIEQISDDSEDPYHYSVIQVLVSTTGMLSLDPLTDLPQLVLNEQYMVASTSSDDSDTMPPTNRVVKILGMCGQKYGAFGENIILLLNRETETSLQLLILKLLYLLFTTKATQDYFYTNDLRVLLDVIIRNLLDLPNELISLRHTYLRVLHPLIQYTQLSNPPYYKRDEVRRIIHLLGDNESAHFAPADETTVRLVARIAQIPWIGANAEVETTTLPSRLLGISLGPSHTQSSVSVVDLAGLTEKPGVQTPSRRDVKTEHDISVNVSPSEKPKPPAPPAPPALRARLPPKAPPRRRTRLRNVVPNEAHIVQH
jgi:hypothetical protein